MGKNNTVVHIAGQEFRLSGAESEEYMQKLAIFVDKKVQEVSNVYPELSTTHCAMLAAMNISDDLMKLRASYNELEGRILHMREERMGNVIPVKHPFESKPVGIK
ncbi:MAG: cell division protein ZapA [Clostridia bacterium]